MSISFWLCTSFFDCGIVDNVSEYWRMATCYEETWPLAKFPHMAISRVRIGVCEFFCLIVNNFFARGIEAVILKLGF